MDSQEVEEPILQPSVQDLSPCWVPPNLAPLTPEDDACQRKPLPLLRLTGVACRFATVKASLVHATLHDYMSRLQVW